MKTPQMRMRVVVQESYNNIIIVYYIVLLLLLWSSPITHVLYGLFAEYFVCSSPPTPSFFTRIFVKNLLITPSREIKTSFRGTLKYNNMLRWSNDASVTFQIFPRTQILQYLLLFFRMFVKYLTHRSSAIPHEILSKMSDNVYHIIILICPARKYGRYIDGDNKKKYFSKFIVL